MDRKESQYHLLTLLLQTIVPLIVAGGATGILTIFKEHLPQLLYSIFLYVIWSAIIVMLILLVLRLILGDSPKKLVKWIKYLQRDRARQKIVKEWHDNWTELRNVLTEVIDTDWKAAEEHKAKYLKLRIWFIGNRSKSLPKWQSFYLNRTKTAYEALLTTNNLEYVVIHKNYEDPFSYFYEPNSLESLGTILKYINKKEIENVLRKLTELTDEFVHWINYKQ